MNIFKLILLTPLVIALAACNNYDGPGNLDGHVEPQLHSEETGHNVQLHSDILHVLRAYEHEELIVINLPTVLNMVAPIQIAQDQNVLFRCQADLINPPSARGQSQFVRNEDLEGIGCNLLLNQYSIGLTLGSVSRHFIVGPRAQVTLQRVGVYKDWRLGGGGFTVDANARVTMWGGGLARLDNISPDFVPFDMSHIRVEILLHRVLLEDMPKNNPLHNIASHQFTTSTFRLTRPRDLR